MSERRAASSWIGSRRGWTTPPLRLELDPAARAGIDAAAALVAQAAAGEAPVYGVNTGFGKLARVRIAPADIAELQRRLVLSHMCGVGAPLDDATVRLVLLLKAASLRLGPLGRAPGHDRRPPAAPGRGRPAGDPGPGLGRRLGRPRAPGPCRRRPDRRRPDPAARARAAGRRGAGRDRPRAADARPPRRAWRCSTARRSRPRWRSAACSRRGGCSTPP